MRFLTRTFELLERDDKWRLGGLFVLMVVGSCLEAVGIGMLPAFVGVLSDPERVLSHPIGGWVASTLGAKTTEEMAIWGAIGLLGLFLVKNLYLTYLTYYRIRFLYRCRVKISARLFGCYLKSPYVFHLQNNPSHLLRNVNQEVTNLIRNVLLPLLEALMEGLLLIMVVALLLAVEPLISIVSVGVLGGSSLTFLMVIRKRNRKHGEREQYFRGRVIQIVQQGLGGVKDAKILGREEFFIEKLKEAGRKLAKSACFHHMVADMPRRLNETMALAGTLLITVILMAQGRSMNEALPILALFAAAAIRLMPALSTVTRSFTNVKYFKPALDVVHGDLEQQGQAKAEAEAQKEGPIEETPRVSDVQAEKIPLKDRIELKGICFTYPASQEPTLKDVSLTITKGMAVGFIGPSGAGKTTLVDVLLGLLTPSEGMILIDGRDVSKDLPAWQRNVGYISQTIYLVDDTIRRNIAFALPEHEIDDERVWQAAKVAQLEEFVNSLPEGMNTVVGDRGVRLSGGQRQRIGIARALYHNPEVLIMDEATSNLDHETERYVIDAIERLKRDRTIIMIAHRLTTVRNCDRLFMLKYGRVVAEGTYETLFENKDVPESVRV